MATPRIGLGIVTAFDDVVGLGTLRGDDGADLDFHCTAISDDTRTIAVGTRVSFVDRATHRGGREARPVTPLGVPA